jgi:hypothetical protein
MMPPQLWRTIAALLPLVGRRHLRQRGRHISLALNAGHGLLRMASDGDKGTPGQISAA